MPASDLKSAVGYARAQGNKISYASCSAGTVSHTLGAELNKPAGLDMVHVPYKGSPPALQDPVAGQVQFMFDGAGNVMPHLKSGRLKVFATTAPTRRALMPEVPTFAELGYKDLTETVWIGLWTTPDTPAPIQHKLREAYATLGLAVGTGSSPDELLDGLRTASDRQAATLLAIGFKPD